MAGVFAIVAREITEGTVYAQVSWHPEVGAAGKLLGVLAAPPEVWEELAEVFARSQTTTVAAADVEIVES